MAQAKYLSIKEVADLLKVAYLTVYRWIKSKRLKAHKAGKQYRIDKTDLQHFIEIKQ